MADVELTNNMNDSLSDEDFITQLQKFNFSVQNPEDDIKSILERNPQLNNCNPDDAVKTNCCIECFCSYFYENCFVCCQGKQGRVVQVPLEDLQPGDHVQWDRGPYHHHAIVVTVDTHTTNAYVIHMSGTNKVNATVRLQKLNFSKEIGTLEKVNYLECNNRCEVLARAYTKYMECCDNKSVYDVCSNNCEHFTLECKVKHSKSVQIQRFISYILCRIATLVLFSLIRGAIVLLLDTEIHDKHILPCSASTGKKIDLIPIYTCIGLDSAALLWSLFKFYFSSCYLFKREKSSVNSESSEKSFDIYQDESKGCCDRYYFCCRDGCYGEDKSTSWYRGQCCCVDFGKASDSVRLFSIFLHFFLMLGVGLAVIFAVSCQHPNQGNKLSDEVKLASFYFGAVLGVELMFFILPFVIFGITIAVRKLKKLCC